MSCLSQSCLEPTLLAAQGQDPQESFKVSVFLTKTSGLFTFLKQLSGDDGPNHA